MKLHKYGIEEEQSDIRAHVSLPGRRVTVYRTAHMVAGLLLDAADAAEEGDHDQPMDCLPDQQHAGDGGCRPLNGAPDHD